MLPFFLVEIDDETFMLMWKSFIKEGRRRNLSLGRFISQNMHWQMLLAR